MRLEIMAATNQEIADAARDAMLAILQGKVQTMSVAGRSYSMQNLSELADLIQGFEKKERKPKVRGATPSW